MTSWIRFILRDKIDGRYITVPENKEGLEVLNSESSKTDIRENAYVFTTTWDGYSDFLEEEIDRDAKVALNPNLFKRELELASRFEVIWVFGHKGG